MCVELIGEFDRAGEADAEDRMNQSLFQETYRMVLRFVGEREISAQEATLDGLRLPLVRYSDQRVLVKG